MKTFYVQVDVKSSHGTQTFAIEAESAESAIDRVRQGGGEVHQTDVEVLALDWRSATVIDEEG